MDTNSRDGRERMLRVAMIGKGWFPDEIGGLDRYFAHLFRGLSALQDVSTQALVVGPAESAPPAVIAVSTHKASLLRRLVAGARAARGLDADVVDAHFALYSLLPLRLTGLRKLPLLVHFQGPWADEGASRGPRAAAKKWIEKAVYRRAARCITLTQAFKRVLVERYEVVPWKIVVEPPGVDLEQFSPGNRAAARSALGVSDGAFVACCVRRLVPRMGIDYLLEAWVEVIERLGRDSRLFVAGDGPLRGVLETRVDELGLANNVYFLGRVTDAELVELYRASDVNVVPTVAHEGFGLIVLEAAACGTPSVVTNVGGLPEAVNGLDPSLVVEAASASAIAERLVGALPSADAALAFAARFRWSEVTRRNLDHLRAVSGDTAAARKLRVVYLDHVAQMSGGEIALLRLLPHLHNVEAHVILAEDGPFADALAAEGISAEVLAMPETARGTRKENVRFGHLSPRAIIGSVTYTLRIARRLRALRPDLVHTNSLKSGVYGAVAARFVGVPVIWHVRDRFAADYLPRSAVKPLQFLVGRLAHAVVANSHATLRTLGEPSRATVVYSVVPEVIQISTVTETRENCEGLVFGIVGRLAPWKGQHVFLEAFARAFPSGDHRAVVVGSAMFGEDEQRYADGLAGQAAALGVADRVEFRGFRDDVWRELRSIDVLVHASTVPEPFGQVVIEGMAAGAAVVASAEGGPLELISDDVDGLLYPPGDVNALTEILARLAGDFELRERLGTAARVRADDFRPGPVAERIEALYAATLSESNE